MEYTQLVGAVRLAGRGGPLQVGSVVSSRTARRAAVTARRVASQTMAISDACVAIGALVE